MRPAFLGLLLLLLAVPSSAATLGLYFDEAGTVTELTVVPLEPFDLYVIARDLDDGILDFQLGLESDESFPDGPLLPGTMVPDPWTYCHDQFPSWTFLLCHPQYCGEDSELLLYRLVGCRVLEPSPDPIQIRFVVMDNGPGYGNCSLDWKLFEVVAPRVTVTSRAVSTREGSWGTLKALFD